MQAPPYLRYHPSTILEEASRLLAMPGPESASRGETLQSGNASQRILRSAGPIWGSDAASVRWMLPPGRHDAGSTGRMLIFLGLNPSRADAKRTTPPASSDRLLKGWGYDALVVVNLFARMSPSPSVLRRCDPVGWTPTLRCCIAPLVVNKRSALWCGWGNGGRQCARAQQVMDLLKPVVQQRARSFPHAPGPQALELTRAGHPRHPLYAPRGCRLKPFQWAGIDSIGHPEVTQTVFIQS